MWQKQKCCVYNFVQCVLVSLKFEKLMKAISYLII